MKPFHDTPFDHIRDAQICGQIRTPDKVFGATNFVEWGIPENTIQIAVQPLQTKYYFGAISSLQLQCKP